MIGYGLELDRIYDIIGIRVIVTTEQDCYRAKYIVSQLFKEVKYDDYIDKPRQPLGYRSLHVIVLHQRGQLIEFQIRDKKMHEYAERGSAAHWIYKVGGSVPDPAIIQRINILRDTLEVLAGEGDISQEEFVEAIREDGLAPHIHVFSPLGKVVSLPEGATPIDFAYHIHTTEDELYLAIAEMRIPSEHPGVTSNQLDKVIGEIAVRRRLAKASMSSSSESVRDLVKWFVDANILSTNRQEALFLSVAAGEISMKHLDQAIQELASPGGRHSISSLPKPIENHSISRGLFFRTAQCCYPVQGDPIVGFVSVGHGLSIHRALCPDALIPERKERIRSYTWQELDPSPGTMFSGKLFITLAASDDSKTYKKIQDVVSRAGGIIRELVPIGAAKRPQRISLIVDVKNVSDLQNILTWFRQIEVVIEARRALDDDGII